MEAWGGATKLYCRFKVRFQVEKFMSKGCGCFYLGLGLRV